MTITIKYFGLIADLTHQKEEVLMIDSPSLKVGELVGNLSQKYPDLSQASFAVAVNKSMAADDLILNNNDVLALLPPFAGG